MKLAENFSYLRGVIDGEEEFAFDGGENVAEVVEVLGGEVVVVSRDIPVRRIKKENGMLSIIPGDEIPEVLALYNYMSKPCPGLLQG